MIICEEKGMERTKNSKDEEKRVNEEGRENRFGFFGVVQKLFARECLTAKMISKQSTNSEFSDMKCS
jgi:hypothetical protein